MISCIFITDKLHVTNAEDYCSVVINLGAL